VLQGVLGQPTCHEPKPLFWADLAGVAPVERLRGGEYFAARPAFPACGILRTHHEEFRGRSQDHVSARQGIADLCVANWTDRLWNALARTLPRTCDRRARMVSSQEEIVAASEVRNCGHQPESAPPIARSIQRAETLTAVDLRSLPSGTELLVETRNSRYRFVVLDDGGNVLVDGGRYFPQETTARIDGCTLGGSLLKLGWIGLGLFLEISACGKRIVTSRVRSISVNVNSACSPGCLGTAGRLFSR
jgi:hypothetical protein